MEGKNTNRYARQKDIIPEDKLKPMELMVIGVGAIGRQVALQLTAIGANNLILVDPDKVEETNIATQGYEECSLNRFKVFATKDDCEEINRRLKIISDNRLFDIKKTGISPRTFCCVDNIDSRKQVWKAAKLSCDFFCDARMAAEVLRVITVYDDKSRKHYPKTLFNRSDAYADRCTAKATFYTANIAAGFMVAQFAKYLRNIPIDYDFTFNLLTNELQINNG